MMSCRENGNGWLPLICLTMLFGRLPAIADETVVLTNAAAVRGLSQEQAARHLPVRLRGTVLEGGAGSGSGMDIHDGTTAVYVVGPRTMVSDLRLRPGDYVEAEGSTDPGEFAPIIQAKSLRKLGRRPFPDARKVTFDDLASGGLDAQWVEVSGIVRYCETPSTNSQKWRLEMAAGSRRLVVRLSTPRSGRPLVDAQVRLRGICYYLVNRNRQALRPVLAVPPGEPINVEVPAPADGFDSPVRPIASIMRFSPDSAYGHRVHVRGFVTCQQPGEIVWIDDGTLGLRVEAQQQETLTPGDQLDVLGFPKEGEYGPVLEDAIFRTVSHGAVPVPLRLAKGEEAFNHDAGLVQLEGMVQERQMIQNGWTFSLRADDGTTFKALLRQPKGAPAPAASSPGSRVRLTGICSVTQEYKQYAGPASGLLHPEFFQLLLRSPDDLFMIRPPPWWTRQRLFWLLGTIAVTSLVMAASVIALARHRLRKQEAQRKSAEAEFSAILSERNRLAREIHDTLAQGLGAISLHLDLARKQLGQTGNGANAHIDLAHNVARASLADARTAIFDMRSQVLENGDLGSALNGILHQMTDGTTVSGKLEVLGTLRRLPAPLENALLRIGQEAITNAEKHGCPTQISVALQFAEKEVRLSVRDDGKGFDPTQLPNRRGSFGMVGMQERAQQLHGSLAVNSRPGAGTEVIFVAPAPRGST